MSSLHRLIYTSTRASYTDEASIQQILTKARPYNRQHNITGVLAYTTKRFLQYIEGDIEALLALYERIAYDRRHYDLQLCDCAPIDERLFPHWQMAYRNLSASCLVLQGSANKHEEETFRQVLQTSLRSPNQHLKVLRQFLLYQ